MTRHNQNPGHDYRALVERINRFQEENSGDDAVRVVADALEDVYLDEFKSAYVVDRASTTACIGRLIGGWGGCKHGWNQPRDVPDDHPPCNPPHSDHADLWLRDGEPAAFTMHLYDVDQEVLDDVLAFADTHGLEVSVEAGSWYFPGRTTLIVFYAPEGLREDKGDSQDR